MKLKLPSFSILHFTFSILLLSGCTSFNLAQTNRFIDEDGRVITVEYGSGDSEYVSTYQIPGRPTEFEFKSKLRVRVQMPEGEKFMAFEVMNELRTGTMYHSDNGKWAFLANGFTCLVFNREKKGDAFQQVFQGVVCQSPEKPRKEQRR